MEHSPEFDCRECGRHIVPLGNPVLQATHPDLCALCWSIPRWWTDPEMSRVFDRDHDRTVAP
jgi:hypothetical protein